MRIHQRYLVIYKKKKPFKWIRAETRNYSMPRLLDNAYQTGDKYRIIVEIDCCSIFIPYKLHLKVEKFLDRAITKNYNSLRMRMRDIIYGSISGFPLCCILEFARRAPRYPHHLVKPDDFVRCGYHCRKSWKKYEQRI